MATESSAFRGLRVLICRPEGRGSALADRLLKGGASVRSLPTIEIVGADETPQLKQTFLDLDQFQHVIFISEPAAQHGAKWIDQYWPQLPLGVNWYAIGEASAIALSSQLPLELNDIIQPLGGRDSEALLKREELGGDLSLHKVLIVRGRGGREKLASVLAERGASISYAEVYQRRCPDYDIGLLKETLGRFDPHLFVCLSAETANNLSLLASRVNFELSQKSFIMPSRRAIDACPWISAEQCKVPSGLAGPDIASSIRAWWQSRTSIKVGE